MHQHTREVIIVTLRILFLPLKYLIPIGTVTPLQKVSSQNPAETAMDRLTAVGAKYSPESTTVKA